MLTNMIMVFCLTPIQTFIERLVKKLFDQSNPDNQYTERTFYVKMKISGKSICKFNYKWKGVDRSASWKHFRDIPREFERTVLWKLFVYVERCFKIDLEVDFSVPGYHTFYRKGVDFELTIHDRPTKLELIPREEPVVHSERCTFDLSAELYASMKPECLEELYVDMKKTKELYDKIPAWYTSPGSIRVDVDNLKTIKDEE